MLPLGTPYENLLRQSGVRSSTPPIACGMFSSVTGHELKSDHCTPEYWRDNLTSMVRFSEALVQCIRAHPSTANIVEIGPHPALKGPVTETLTSAGNSNIKYFHSCLREENDFISLLNSAGEMLTQGVRMNLDMVNAEPDALSSGTGDYITGKVLTDLPKYPWNHSTGFWVESRMSRRLRFRVFPRHQLIGSRIPNDIPSHPIWRNQWLLEEIPWLADMKVRI